MPRRKVSKKSVRAASRSMECDERALIVLFSQASIFSFPGLWRLRSVCRTWRDAIESTGVLSSHVAQRERISKLQGVEVTKEGLRDVLLIDHIVDAVEPFDRRVPRSFDDNNIRTEGFEQSLRVSHMLRTLDRLALPAASAVCSLLGDVRVASMARELAPGAKDYVHIGPVAMALTSLSIANAAAGLVSEISGRSSVKMRIVIETLKDTQRPIECLEDSLLIVPPMISSSEARTAIARAIKVFTRVQEIASKKNKNGESLVAAVTGVGIVGEQYAYSPTEQHLWVGMILFPEEVQRLKGEYLKAGKRHGVSPEQYIVVPWNLLSHKLQQLADA
eukprot:m51a1_g14102 hypothetical protein (333) ;mRNA; f:95832-96830